MIGAASLQHLDHSMGAGLGVNTPPMAKMTSGFKGSFQTLKHPWGKTPLLHFCCAQDFRFLLTVTLK